MKSQSVTIALKAPIKPDWSKRVKFLAGVRKRNSENINVCRYKSIQP